MENDLRLSVIIPTHETRELTLRCLAALWLCDPRPHEVIVVDNASEDDSVSMLRRDFPDVILHESGENLGFGRGCNRGIFFEISGYTLVEIKS